MGTLRLHRHGAPPLEVSQDRVLVGRDPTCDMVIDDKSVSRRHAYFERRGPGWAIVDQGSANGTFVNGAQVMDAALQDGQELRLGMVPLRVEMESAASGTVLMGGGGPVQGTVMMPAGGMPNMAPPAAPAPMAAPASWGAHQPQYAAPAQPAYAPPPAPAYAPPPQQYAPAPSPYAQPAAPAYTPSPQEEAAATLGVHPQAGPEEVKARYTELAADLDTKLANARTPHLKSTYQRNLDELRKAAELLSPGFTTVDVADLPAAAPTVVPHEMDISLPEAVRMMGEKPPDAAEPKSGLPPTSAVTVGFIAMGMLALTAYFGLSAGKLQKAIIKKLADPAIVQADNDAIKYKSVEALEQAGVLINGKLKLCNKGTQPFEVGWMGAVFAAKSPDTGKTILTAFNSGYCGADLRVTIPAGGEKVIDISGSDPRCKWDGQALFYSVSFKDPKDPEKQLRLAGPLHNRTDCVNFGEGW
jgi:FHA domain-containing protein